jgi:hypothetical protein
MLINTGLKLEFLLLAVIGVGLISLMLKFLLFYVRWKMAVSGGLYHCTTCALDDDKETIHIAGMGRTFVHITHQVSYHSFALNKGLENPVANIHPLKGEMAVYFRGKSGGHVEIAIDETSNWELNISISQKSRSPKIDLSIEVFCSVGSEYVIS